MTSESPTPTELARIHLECAWALRGAAFIQTWLMEKQTAPTTISPQQPSRRGRKPGAAPVDMRCTWVFPNGSQCKNRRAEDVAACRIHASKLHLITGIVVSHE